MIINGPSSTDSLVTLADGVQLDSFGRLRVSEAYTVYDSQQEYGLDTLRLWDATANGTLSITTGSSNGSVTNGANAVGPRDVNTRMTPITVSTTTGHYSVLQSRQYIRYIPGKSHLVLITGIFSPGTVANTDARSGYFDSANGIFLKVTNGANSFVRRTSTSGSVVDNAVNQSDWNIDKFDGAGPSGITIDLTKTQILFITAQWLGVGRVIVGFDVGGVLYPAHAFLNANVLTVPYTQTFNLPIRMELRNTGASAGATIQFVCCSAQSEGGVQLRGWAGSASNGITPIAVTTRRPVISIRPVATYNGVTNRAHIENLVYTVRAATNDAYIEMVIGGALTGATWVASGANSIVQYDITATALTGGDSIGKSFAVSGSGGTKNGNTVNDGLDLRTPLVISQIDALAATQISMTLMATSFNATSNVTAALDWVEQVV
jgi:hypothetical protein